MKKFNSTNTFIVGLLVNFFVALILVWIFRNEYTESNIFYDTFVFLLIVEVINLLFGLRNIIVSFITNLITKTDSTDTYFKHIVSSNFPKPNELFHLDDPEDYLQDVIEDSETERDALIFASGLVAEINIYRNQYQFYKLYLLNRRLKKIIKQYLHYCLKQERQEV